MTEIPDNQLEIFITLIWLIIVELGKISFDYKLIDTKILKTGIHCSRSFVS